MRLNFVLLRENSIFRILIIFRGNKKADILHVHHPDFSSAHAKVDPTIYP